MRWFFGFVCAGLWAAVPVTPSSAQISDDPACNQLLRAGRFGLHVVYPSGSGAPQPVNGQPLRYDPDARFYYVARGNGGNAVWHIRTQTTARIGRGADEAIVYRPPLSTSCRASAFQAFDKDTRYVSLDSYIDHHASSDEGFRENPDLTRNFHFEAPHADQPGCYRTDDRRIFGADLSKIYGFDRVSRRGTLWARATRIGQAVAAGTQYAGLTSELTFNSGAGPACFGFVAPLPTSSNFRSQLLIWYRDADARRAAQTWGPLETTVVIKQIRGRNVAELPRQKITWKP